MDRFISLSYSLNQDLSAYGNGEKLQVERICSITSGDTSNNSVIKFSLHLGTHIDFPFHFCSEGKKSSEYELNYFIFDKVGLVHLNINDNDLLINQNLIDQCTKIPTNIEFLIIKTGYSHFRKENKYWENNPGFEPELAGKLRRLFPDLRVMGFDSISLSCYKHREIGRIAHKEFLCNHNILLVEDMNLAEITNGTKIIKVIIAPLLVENLDAAPVNVIAEIEND